MQHSIINKSEIENTSEIRLDAEYYHPEFIKNSAMVLGSRQIRDFVLSDISIIKTSPINRDFEYLEISRISLSTGGYETVEIKRGHEPDRAHYILKRGDIVVSMVRPNRNAIAFIEKDDIIGSSGLSVLRADGISSEYLFAFCKTTYFIKCLMRANKASMYPAVSSNDIFNIFLYLPSDALISLITKTIRGSFFILQKAKEIYKQAQDLLLSELGLVNWKPKRQLTFIKSYSDTAQAERIDAEYYQPKYDEIISAIKGYSGGWDKLGKLAHIKKCIEVGSAEYLNEGIPFVRVSNISPFEITAEKYISEKLYADLTPNEPDISFEKSQNHQPQQGEILFSKDATPGIAYYLEEKPEKMIPSSGILRLKSRPSKVNNEYLTLVLNSILTREQVNQDVGGSVILHWRLDQVKATIIPILPEEKQLEIQQKVTESFSLRKQSKHHLECAKRAVEIAIEHDENTAIAWLQQHTKHKKQTPRQQYSPFT